jgi:SAM-dependent methyltransferase
MKKILTNKIHKDIDIYYTKKIKIFGPSPLGVDWRDEESQQLRFEQLSKIVNLYNSSLNDIGCGYEKYLDFIKKKKWKIRYTGYDLSKDMIYNATKIYPKNKFFHISNLNKIKVADYSIASGIFNVKMQYKNSEWISYIIKTLDGINTKSIKGFSFNILTRYSNKQYMRNYLYYADPLFFFDYCKKNYSKNISLNHDYNLYEFTILVRKN